MVLKLVQWHLSWYSLNAKNYIRIEFTHWINGTKLLLWFLHIVDTVLDSHDPIVLQRHCFTSLTSKKAYFIVN